jgi:hypothetical protein
MNLFEVYLNIKKSAIKFLIKPIFLKKGNYSSPFTMRDARLGRRGMEAALRVGQAVRGGFSLPTS